MTNTIEKTKVIVSSEVLCSEFVRLCKTYKHIAFMTAWAGNTKVIDELYKVRNKIHKAVVGLSFYHTSPDFIKRFKDANIKYYVDSVNESGIFHPKTYLFYNDENDWSAIIGSSNLTEGGFVSDMECNVLLSSKTAEDFKSIKNAINDYYSKSIYYSNDFVNYYVKKYEKRPQMKNEPIPHNFSMSGKTWEQYWKQLEQNNTEINTIPVRLAVLDCAKKWMKSPLSNLELGEQMQLAGLIYGDNPDIDWMTFGSTKGKGTFLQQFRDKAKYRNDIYKALDIIPLKGEVTKKDYESYIKSYKKASGYKNPLTSATRFLAMKRPDVFVCITDNNKGICELLGLKTKNITLDNYWERIVENVQASKWYNEEVPVNVEQRKVYEYRVAMLDALYY